ncbi:hypothetical protein GCM10009863_24740 [Streptomyces axinellae]|uniref:Uncharacterized protein n=1 Tax=Streptomyces axinellae TaxID=552788 RepID=A0ABN3Q0R6_9ACTN
MKGVDASDRLGGGTGLAHDLDVGFDREHVAHSPADHLVIIDQEYADSSVFGHPFSLTY